MCPSRHISAPGARARNRPGQFVHRKAIPGIEARTGGAGRRLDVRDRRRVLFLGHALDLLLGRGRELLAPGAVVQKRVAAHHLPHALAGCEDHCKHDGRL